MIQLPARFPLNFTDSQGPDKELLSPNDRKLLTKIQYATSSDIEFLLGLLPEAQNRMGKLKAFERSNILRKMATILQENAEKLAWLIATEGGKPMKDARIEVSRAQTTFELCAEETLRLGGENIPMDRTPAGAGHLAITSLEPIGPVLAISAFNHPLNLLAHQAGCAIAAGNAVVIKPAPGTPLCAFKLEKFFLEAGLPSECIFVVNADIPEITQLITSTQFAFVSFIGSARVGWELRSKLAPGTRLSLEHGGQAPAIVRADANLDLAVSSLIKGAFYHAGQVCISTQKIYVHQEIYDLFLEKFSKAASKLKTGPATKDDTDVGPLIRPGEVVRIQSWIDEAMKMGAELKLGNKTQGEENQYLLPTILTSVPAASRLMKEEVFGPVVCINSYLDEDKLLREINDTQYVFEGCVFTQDIGRALHIARDVSAMTMVINNHNAYRVDWMPFGGHRLSGLGMGGVRYAIEEMSRLKQTIIRY